MIFTAAFILGGCLVSAIPFSLLLNKVYVYFREVYKETRPHMYVSFAPFIYILEQILEFFKGFCILYFSTLYIEFDSLYLCSLIVFVCAHNFSPFLKFKNQGTFFIFLWGCFTAIYLPFILIYPLLFVLFSLLLNSFIYGQLLSVLILFYFNYFFGLSEIYYYVYLLFLIVILLSYGNLIIQSINGKKSITIWTSFQKRLL